MGKKELVKVELDGVGKIKCPMCGNEVFIHSMYYLDKPPLSILQDEAETLRCDDCDYILFFHTKDPDTSYMKDSHYKKRKELKIIPIKE